MPAVTGLGHVGFYVSDFDRSVDFYTRVIGLQKSDVDYQRRFAFLSAHPEEEHHEVFLMEAPDKVDPKGVQQASFRCASLDDVVAFKKVFAEEEVRIDQEVTHGNAVSIYFFDPDGYRLEVYWKAPREVHPPFAAPIDLTKSNDEIMRQVDEAITRIRPPVSAS
jgi:catechol 2,3-dioxygenase-like lactoylglutathione lyase family enzyme